MKMSIMILCLSLSPWASAQVFDMHTHVLSWAKPDDPVLYKFNAENLLKSLDKAGIDKAVVLSFGYAFIEADRVRTETENNFVASLMQKYSNRFIGFCSVPIKVTWALDELKRCFEVLHLKGLKLHPATNNLDFRKEEDKQALSKIMAETQKIYKVPMLLDANMGSTRDNNVLFGLAARTHNKLPVILAHVGGNNFRDLVNYVQLYEVYPSLPRNVYFDFSATMHTYAGDNPEKNIFVWYLRKWGVEHLVFGSDNGGFTSDQAYKAFRTEFGFSTREIEKMQSSNPKKTLGLN